MIRFKQRMSSATGTAPPSLAVGGDRPPSAATSTSAPSAGSTSGSRRVSEASTGPPLLRRIYLDSVTARHPPPSSSSDCCSVASSGCESSSSKNRIAASTRIPAVANIEICAATCTATSSGKKILAPPIAAVAAASPPDFVHASSMVGKKRTVSDATEESSRNIHTSSKGSSSSTSASSADDDSDSSTSIGGIFLPTTKRARTDPAKDSLDSSAPIATNELTNGIPTTVPPPRLLAVPTDALHLNPLHCFVRRQIEVFAATAQDVAAPCPGRRVRVQLGQAGLRCVHCKRAEMAPAAATAIHACRPVGESNDSSKSTTKSKVHTKRPRRTTRTKRAVCYPSTVARVYNSVSDMKFDHFAICPHMPAALRHELDMLRSAAAAQHGGENNKAPAGIGGGNGRRSSSSSSAASSDGSVASTSSSTLSPSVSSLSLSSAASSSSTSSTARYYHDTALQVGLVDAPVGIRLIPTNNGACSSERQPTSKTPPLPTMVNIVAKGADSTSTVVQATTCIPKVPSAAAAKMQVVPALSPGLPPLPPPHTTLLCAPLSAQQLPSSSPNDDNSITSSQTFLLTAPEDEQILNPIHCFVRRNVEVFAATAADIAAPAPGRKNRVVLGQVGIRCVHCADLPQRDRVKRSICYPPNVSGIYHAVSNMKFDHFGTCKGLNAEVRAEFQTLRASCGRKGGGKAATKCSSRASAANSMSRGATSTSTAQYYHDSALNLGLVDTADGIRFLPDQAARLRAAATMVIHAHQGPWPPVAALPTLPPMALPTQVQLLTMSATLPPLENISVSASTAVTPDQQSIYPSLISSAQVRRPIPNGLSALMIAAAERAAERAPQVPTTGTNLAL